MTYKVPFVDAKTHYARIKPEVDAAINDCLSNGELIMRRHLRDYEEHLAAFVGTKYAVGVNSGYHALHLSLLAAGIGPGDEVITVAHTFVATISAIIHTGAVPILVDVCPDYNMNLDETERAITHRTKAILPVHLNGRVCNMAHLMAIAEKHNLLVIEDAAQALGAKYQDGVAGSFGAAGCFSHYPFKVLGCFGDGGSVTTNDPDIARKVSLLRFNGEDRETGEYHYHGYTALLDNVQAAILDTKLKYLSEWIGWRRQIAALYQKGLSGLDGVRLPPFDDGQHFDIFQNYVIRTDKRDDLKTFLKDRGVETLVHWPKPVWEHEGLGLGKHHLPETESISKQVLSLPMSAETTEEQADYVVAYIREYFC